MLTRTRPSRAGAGRCLIGALLLIAAVLDLARCSLVLMTFGLLAPALGLIAAGIAAAALSVAAARGYWAGRRWAGLAAILLGVASGPLASASGFRDPFTIPDVATTILGIVLAVAVLAAAGRGMPGQRALSRCGTSPPDPRRLAPPSQRAHPDCGYRSPASSRQWPPPRPAATDSEQPVGGDMP